MSRRLIAAAAGGVASLLVVIALATAWGAFDPPLEHPAIRPAPVGPGGWKETRRYGVNRVVIIEGESTHPERAEDIARGLIEPRSGLYDEVLIYVRPSTALRDSGGRTKTWRVQWTEAAGFQVLTY